jgi:hypothetical protein
VSPLLLLFLAPAPIDFDLQKLAGTQRCVARGENDILVCGHLSTSDRQRVRAEPERYVVKPLVAEITLPNGWKANLNATSAELPGAISKRAMVTLKIPF